MHIAVAHVVACSTAGLAAIRAATSENGLTLVLFYRPTSDGAYEDLILVCEGTQGGVSAFVQMLRDWARTATPEELAALRAGFRNNIVIKAPDAGHYVQEESPELVAQGLIDAKYLWETR